MFSDLRLIYARYNNGSNVFSLADTRIHFNDLTFLLKGSLSYTVDGVEVTLNAGDALWVQEGAYRARKGAPAGETEYLSFNFLSGEELNLPTVIKNCVTEELPHLLNAAIHVTEAHYGNTEKKTEQILKCILLSLQSKENERKQHPLVVQIKRYLHGHMKEKITLADLAAETHFSAVHCEGVFKRETGDSIVEYLLKSRVRRAKRLLNENVLPLQQIAEETGFTDYNYFSRAFKKHVGISPLKYKATRIEKG